MEKHKPESGLAINLPFQTGEKRAWLGHYRGIGYHPEHDGPLYDTAMVDPSHQYENVWQFTFPEDGLYQAQGSGEVEHRYYKVKNGNIHHLNETQWTREASNLPPVDGNKIVERMQNQNKRLKLGGNTYEHKDWIKSSLQGKWNPADQVWEIPKQWDQNDALLSELRKRGISVVDWNHSAQRATA